MKEINREYLRKQAINLVNDLLDPKKRKELSEFRKELKLKNYMAKLLDDPEHVRGAFGDSYMKGIINKNVESLSKALGYTGNKLAQDLKAEDYDDFDTKRYNKEKVEKESYRIEKELIFIEFVLEEFKKALDDGKFTDLSIPVKQLTLSTASLQKTFDQYVKQDGKITIHVEKAYKHFNKLTPSKGSWFSFGGSEEKLELDQGEDSKDSAKDQSEDSAKVEPKEQPKEQPKASTKKEAPTKDNNEMKFDEVRVIVEELIQSGQEGIKELLIENGACVSGECLQFLEDEFSL